MYFKIHKYFKYQNYHKQIIILQVQDFNIYLKYFRNSLLYHRYLAMVKNVWLKKLQQAEEVDEDEVMILCIELFCVELRPSM